MGEFPTVITRGCCAGTNEIVGIFTGLGIAIVVPAAITWDGLITIGWLSTVIVMGGDPGEGLTV